jgi:hypothetical protein
MLRTSQFLTRSREDAKWGGVPGTQHPESPPTSHAGFSHAQNIAIPHAKSRSREVGDTPLRSRGHTTTKPGTHHRKRGHTITKQTADCQQIPPRRSLTLHRPPAFQFASSRLRVSPTVPESSPARTLQQGTGDTAREPRRRGHTTEPRSRGHTISKPTADCQQIPRGRSVASHQPLRLPSRLRVRPTVPKGLPSVRCVPLLKHTHQHRPPHTDPDGPCRALRVLLRLRAIQPATCQSELLQNLTFSAAFVFGESREIDDRVFGERHRVRPDRQRHALALCNG